MKKKIILIGTGGHAKSCINILDKSKEFTLEGLIGEKNDLRKIISGYKIIGTDKDLNNLCKKIKYCVIGLGQIKSNIKRLKIFNLIKKIGFKIPNIISNSSIIASDVKIGEGTFVFHKVFINNGVAIGKNCIINTSSIIEHDVSIGENTHISTGVIINGNVKIGKNVFIGSGSIIKNNIFIADNVIIGMGMIIKKNVIENSVVK